MFKRISRSLALQFTGFVFLLFLVNGAIFLVADFGNARRQTNFRMAREAQFLMRRIPPTLTGALFPPPPPPGHFRDRFRILDASGKPLAVVGTFPDAPLSGTGGRSIVNVQGEPYDVLTTPVFRSGRLKGYVQLAERQQARIADLPPRAFIYILVSVLISGLTFIVGHFFAKRSLKPAEEMFQRLGQFTQDASHELRTPLAVLGSSLDVALKTGNFREGLLSAKEDLQQISRLVERLLELTRLDQFTLELRSVDLTTLTQETAEKFRALAREKPVTVDTTIEPDVRVQGDATLLSQVLGNLLSNAIKFNTSHGKVTVRLTKNSLVISDTGIGIDSADLPHVFDRFYRADTSRSRDGYGLGLALVKRIVDLHGFRISLHSEKGKGTSFTITFS